MSKKKISSTSPWVFGKGKDLTQSIGSGKNASVLGEYLNQMPKQVSPTGYPSEIFQDVLSARDYNTAKPAQAVISDMLPTVYQVPDTKPSYSNVFYQDDAFKNRPGLNFTFAGDNYLPAVQSERLPAIVNQADNSAGGIIDDVVKPIAKKGIGIGTKIASGLVSGLPGIGDIIMPEYVNASENGFDLRNEIAKREQHKIASDAELARMLGINAPDNFMMPVPTNPYAQAPSREIASNEPPQVVDEPQAASPQSSITPANNSATTQAVNQQSSGGDDRGVTGNGMSYEEILKRQMDALNAQAAGRSTFSYLDLSPLMQAVDNMTGSKMAQSYKGPRASADNDMAKVAGLAEKLADEAARKKQADIQLLNATKNNAYDRYLYQAQLEAIKAQNKMNIDNNKASNKLGAEPKPDQFKVGTFAKRVDEAESIFQELDDANFNRANRMQGVLSYLPGSLQGENLKKQSQAERNFTNAVLRRESGSAISDSEFKSAEEQYFPRAGDPPELIEQKRRNRQIVIAGLKAEAGEKAMNLINNQLNAIQPQPNVGRSPTRPVSNMVKDTDLEERVKAALEKAKANKAQ